MGEMGMYKRPAAPGAPAKISGAKRARSSSPRTGTPVSSTTPTRSPSPSKAKPTSARLERTFFDSRAKVSVFSGLASWCGKLPSGSRQIVSSATRGQRLKSFLMMAPSMPWRHPFLQTVKIIFKQIAFRDPALAVGRGRVRAGQRQIAQFRHAGPAADRAGVAAAQLDAVVSRRIVGGRNHLPPLPQLI